MAKTPKYKSMTEQDLTLIKTIITLNPDKTLNAISKLVGRSYPTITYVNRAQDFADYKSIVKTVNAPTNAKKAVKQAEKSSESPQQNKEEELIQEFTQVLTNIKEALEAINENPDVAVPKRKLW